MTHTHRIGLNRREILQVGYSGLLGLTAASLVRTTANAAPILGTGQKKPKSVIMVFCTGAISHIDSFDPKPDAPAEIRGEFGIAKTRITGLNLSEHLPLLAARASEYAIVRSFAHKDNNHTAATHHYITGALQPNVRFDKPLSRADWPCFGAGVAYAKPPAEGIPAGVTLPTFLQEGPLIWPGQHGGFLGVKYDPWQVKSDPNSKEFKASDLASEGLDVQTLGERHNLLNEISKRQRAMAKNLDSQKLTDQQDKAFAVLANGAVANAFDLRKENDATRDRYGRHLFGQSLLLARRLAAAGVPVVQANMGRVQNWDTHSNNFKRLKNDLLPALDKGVSALIDDLKQSGRLDDTLVIVGGEFGRSPKVQANDGGRDHWAACFSVLFCGGGVRGGQIIGSSDKTAAYPTTVPYALDDMGATIYAALGIDPAMEVRDRVNRPVRLNAGQAIDALYRG